MDKYNFTPNEHLAALHLIDVDMFEIGAKRPSDVDGRGWCDVSVLRDAGWTKEQAAGTYGSLAEKGAITIEEIDEDDPLRWEDSISFDLYEWAEEHWDEFVAKGKPKKHTLSNRRDQLVTDRNTPRGVMEN